MSRRTKRTKNDPPLPVSSLWAMTRANWIFGIWAAINVAAFASYLLALVIQGTAPIPDSTLLGITAVATTCIPFAQATILNGRLGLNTKGVPNPYRKEAWARWRQLFFRLPIPSIIGILCLLLAGGLILSTGRTKVKFDSDNIQVRRVFVAVGIVFNYAVVYANLFVVRRCPDMLPKKYRRRRRQTSSSNT